MRDRPGDAGSGAAPRRVRRARRRTARPGVAADEEGERLVLVRRPGRQPEGEEQAGGEGQAGDAEPEAALGKPSRHSSARSASGLGASVSVMRFRRFSLLASCAVPIYEYRCPHGHTFEVFQRMSDPPAETCQVCGAGPVEKVLFPVAVHFKGSGFYSTDYGRGKKAAEGRRLGLGSSDASRRRRRSRRNRARARRRQPPRTRGCARPRSRRRRHPRRVAAAGARSVPRTWRRRRRCPRVRGSPTRRRSWTGSPPSRQCSALAGSARKQAQPSCIELRRRSESVASGAHDVVADERQAQRRCRRSSPCRRSPSQHLLLPARAVEVVSRTGRAGSGGCASRRARAGRPSAARPCSNRQPSQCCAPLARSRTGSRTVRQDRLRHVDRRSRRPRR